VFEGLAKGAMKEIEILIKKDKPNNKNFRILKNKSILF